MRKLPHVIKNIIFSYDSTFHNIWKSIQNDIPKYRNVPEPLMVNDGISNILVNKCILFPKPKNTYSIGWETSLESSEFIHELFYQPLFFKYKESILSDKEKKSHMYNCMNRTIIVTLNGKMSSRYTPWKYIPLFPYELNTYENELLDIARNTALRNTEIRMYTQKT